MMISQCRSRAILCSLQLFLLILCANLLVKLWLSNKAAGESGKIPRTHAEVESSKSSTRQSSQIIHAQISESSSKSSSTSSSSSVSSSSQKATKSKNHYDMLPAGFKPEFLVAEETACDNLDAKAIVVLTLTTIKNLKAR